MVCRWTKCYCRGRMTDRMLHRRGLLLSIAMHVILEHFLRLNNTLEKCRLSSELSYFSCAPMDTLCWIACSSYLWSIFSDHRSRSRLDIYLMSRVWEIAFLLRFWNQSGIVKWWRVPGPGWVTLKQNGFMFVTLQDLLADGLSDVSTVIFSSS